MPFVGVELLQCLRETSLIGLRECGERSEEFGCEPE